MSQRHLRAYFGYEAPEVVGGGLNEVIVPGDERLRAEAETIDEVCDFPFRSAPIEHGGEVAEQFGLYVDITDRERYERKLEPQSERLGEFTGAVSHDLRGLLSIAEGRLELARADCDSPHLEGISAATGTGFGLAIAGEIADAYGWEVDVTGSEAGSARFEISVSGVEPAG